MSPSNPEYNYWEDQDEDYEDEDETSEQNEDDEDVSINKGKKITKENIKRLTADDYFAIYPQDRRSKAEINSLLEKNKEYLKKLHGKSNRKEKQNALMVAVHVDFAKKIEEISKHNGG